MARRIAQFAILVAFLSIPLGFLYNAYGPALHQSITVVGIFRHPAPFARANSEDVVVIESTVHCEDIHYDLPSHRLYTACEDSSKTRFSWFPPLVNFDASVVREARAGIYVIDPDTKKAQRLQLDNFSGPFITHGIDVISDPEKQRGKAVYIFAVNHLPNPDFYTLDDDGNYTEKSGANSGKVPRARSQIEIFHHTVGSSSARHIRSVQDPLIITPNDILALSPKQFLVTNDHFYRDGLMREWEDGYRGALWSNTIYVELSDLSKGEPTSGFEAKVVLEKLHNNNGLGHGRTLDEILVGSAASGLLHLGKLSKHAKSLSAVEIVDVIQLDSSIDNPSYFSDPFSNSSFDASGFVLAGLARSIDLGSTKQDPNGKDPVIVWYVTKGETGWEKRIIFEDDGSTLRSASAGVLVAIDPSKENGKRRAWLYVTGFVSSNIIAVKVDL